MDDLVYQGDPIEAAADGAAPVVFKDGTAHNPSAGVRRAPRNDFTCPSNATSDRARLRVAGGFFAFIAGRAAKTARSGINAAVASIRAVTPCDGTGLLTRVALTVAALDELRADGEFAILDDGVITPKDLKYSPYEILTRWGQLVPVDDPGEAVVVDTAGQVTRIRHTAARMAELYAAQQAALATFLQGQDPGAAVGGSSTPLRDDGTPDLRLAPLAPLPINFQPPPALESPTVTFAGNTLFVPPPTPALLLSPAPALPNAPAVRLSNDSGSSSTDNITNSGALAITGLLSGASVAYSIDGGTTWTSSFSAVEGVNTVLVRQTDPAGAVSTAPTFSFVLDTGAPSPPVMSSFGAALAAAGVRSSHNDLLLTGTAEPNATITVYDGTSELGTTIADDTGAWTYPTGTLTEGGHTFTATATDAAGNTSSASEEVDVTVDATAPAAPLISAFADDTAPTGDGVTADDDLLLTGSAEANATITVYDGTT